MCSKWSTFACRKRFAATSRRIWRRWSSNIDQRKGRVSIDSCYWLITKELYDAYFALAEVLYPQPSIDKLVLDVKRLKVPSHFKPKVDILFMFSLFYLCMSLRRLTMMCNEQDVLSMALSPSLSLKEAVALTLYKDGKFVCDDGELTFAGRIMAELQRHPPLQVDLVWSLLRAPQAEHRAGHRLVSQDHIRTLLQVNLRILSVKKLIFYFYFAFFFMSFSLYLFVRKNQRNIRLVGRSQLWLQLHNQLLRGNM